MAPGSALCIFWVRRVGFIEIFTIRPGILPFFCFVCNAVSALKMFRLARGMVDEIVRVLDCYFFMLCHNEICVSSPEPNYG